MILVAASTSLCSAIYLSHSNQANTLKNSAIHWLSIEEALKAQEDNPKKIFIDMYTDWCGWCKVMDQKTFADPSVIKTLNENFYAVKFNAEQTNPVKFNGRTYNFIPSGQRLNIIKGYQTVDRFLPQIQ